MTIYEKLAAIQAELKAPKDQYNAFGRYKYRSCEDIVEAVKPLLAKHAAALTLSDAVKLISDRYYIEATATIYDTESDLKVSVSAFAREPDAKKGMDESQITGMASSYARKYALNGLFAIDDTKDADTMDNTVKSQSGPGKGNARQEAPHRQTAKEQLLACFRKNNWSAEALAKKYSRDSVDSLTEADCMDYIETLASHGVEVAC